jgi:hypothetical protein
MRWTWLIALAGCGRFGFGPPPLEDAPAADGTVADDAVVTGDAGFDWCEGVRADTVALYRFEPPAPAADATGQHSGTLRGTASAVASPCGQGIALGAGGYVLVPDAPAFDLDTGSIELLVRVTSMPATEQALLTRDSEGTADGHLLIQLASVGNITVRMQRSGAGSFSRCSPVLPLDTWVHLGVSFGGLPEQGFRLWLDHVESPVLSFVDPSLGAIDCTAPHAFGLAGNDNALVIGASNALATAGNPDPPTTNSFTNGMLDQVRLSSSWRDFGR